MAARRGAAEWPRGVLISDVHVFARLVLMSAFFPVFDHVFARPVLMRGVVLRASVSARTIAIRARENAAHCVGAHSNASARSPRLSLAGVRPCFIGRPRRVAFSLAFGHVFTAPCRDSRSRLTSGARALIHSTFAHLSMHSQPDWSTCECALTCPPASCILICM